MKRRLIAGFAAMAMALSLAACGGNNANTPSGSSSGDGSSTPSSEPVTVRWFWREGGDIQVPDDSYMSKKILELINVKYIHITPIGQTVEEKLTTMMSTGDIPDIAESWNEYTTQLRDFGAIIPVDDLINGGKLDKVKNNQMLFEEAWDNATRADGKHWAIPATFSTLDGSTPWIRYDWLENLNLEVPTTFEELADVLAAFTNDDPDGNGVADTYGTSYGGVWAGFADNFGASTTTWYYTEDGGLEWGLFSDNMVPYMQYMKGLIDNGGLFNEITDPEELGSKHGNAVKAGKLGFSFGYNNYTMNDEIRKVEGHENADWRPMAPPKGIYDKGYLPFGGSVRQEYVIFRDAEKAGKLDAVCDLMNLMADDGGDPTKVNWDAPYWEVNYGEKGVNWDVVDGVMQTNANNETIKLNNEGKDYLNGRCRRWRTVSSQIGLDTAKSEEVKAAEAAIASYPLITDMPKEAGYRFSASNAETVSGYQELVQNFNTVWNTYFMNAWLGQADIESGLADCRQQALNFGYEDVRDRTIELYKTIGILG